MLLMNELNRISQARYEELHDLGFHLERPKEYSRSTSSFFKDYAAMGLHADPMDPANPGRVHLSRKGLITPEFWIPQVVQTAWDLLTTKPKENFSIHWRTIRQNKAVPLDLVKMIYVEAGHPLTITVVKVL